MVFQSSHFAELLHKPPQSAGIKLYGLRQIAGKKEEIVRKCLSLRI